MLSALKSDAVTPEELPSAAAADAVAAAETDCVVPAACAEAVCTSGTPDAAALFLYTESVVFCGV